MSAQGYELVALAALDAWAGITRNKGMLVALLSWLVGEIRAELAVDRPGVRVEVVRVDYAGAYPAIGVLYGDDTGPSVAAQVEVIVAQALIGGSLDRFMRFALQSDCAWEDVAARLLS